MSDIYQSPAAELATDNVNTSGMGKGHPIPEGIKGWSWGAFLLNWIWAIGNKTWIGLLSFIPYLGFIMVIILGVKGREWAWQNKRWENIEHFNRVQKRWAIWGIALMLIPIIGIIAAIAIPAYQDYINAANM
ncbi:MAG TPA: hypothetical protein VIQ03_05870 [Gammaproteobacteria bacterium]